MSNYDHKSNDNITFHDDKCDVIEKINKLELLCNKMAENCVKNEKIILATGTKIDYLENACTKEINYVNDKIKIMKGHMDDTDNFWLMRHDIDEKIYNVISCHHEKVTRTLEEQEIKINSLDEKFKGCTNKYETFVESVVNKFDKLVINYNELERKIKQNSDNCEMMIGVINNLTNTLEQQKIRNDEPPHWWVAENDVLERKIQLNSDKKRDIGISDDNLINIGRTTRF